MGLNNEKEFVLDTLRAYGLSRAKGLQNEASTVSNDALNEARGFEPSFVAACQKMNMLERKAGFICVSSAGRVVKLLQPYDSTVFIQEPEELAAQWGFVWPTNPDYAMPFVSINTSPYNKDDVCTETTGEEGQKVTKIYRSLVDNNTWAPKDAPSMWEVVE